MSTYPVITVSGINLTDSSGRWYLDPSQGLRGAPGRVANSVSIPGRQGTLRGHQEVYAAQVFPISLLVLGRGNSTDVMSADLDLNINALKYLFHQDSVTINYQASALQKYVAEDTRCLSMDIQPLNQTEARVTFVMEISTPFWRSPTAATVEYMTAGASTTFVSAAGSTAPITDAEFVIVGPASWPRITDPTTGQWVQLSVDIPSTHIIYINCKTFSAYKIAGWGTETNNLGDYTQHIANGGAGSANSWLTLYPSMSSDPGTRTVRAALNGGLGAGGSCSAKVRATYL